MISELRNNCGKYSFTISRTIELTDEQVDTILVTALEGGIYDWAVLCNDTPVYKRVCQILIGLKGQDDVYYSTVVKTMLDLGYSVQFESTEYYEGQENDPDYKPEVWELTKSKFIDGCRLYEEQFGGLIKKLSEGDFDARDADSLIQLALFGEVIYG